MTASSAAAQMTLPANGTNGCARQLALDTALGNFQAQPTPMIEFHSAGRLLILGPGEAALAAASRLGDSLNITLLLAPDDPAGADDPRVARAPLHELGGHFGHYLALVEHDGERLNLSSYMAHADYFDLVLDLHTEPTLPQQMPPLGYYATGGDAARLETAVDELPQLVGTFAKPKFFNYDPAICVHGRMGQTGCSRCIDACPTLAITSLGERIEVNPNFCQGGGTCVAACPSGALRYAYPPLADLLTTLRQALAVYRDNGGDDPRILFYGGERFAEAVHEAKATMPENLFPVELEEIASLGMEAWFSLLAYGASQILLYVPTGLPPLVRETLDEQVGFAHALLAGMGYPAERLQIIDAQDGTALADALQQQPSLAPLSAAEHRLGNDKRVILRDALDHLYALAGATVASVPLPDGAPFGQVRVDTQRCTLCNACAAICPLHAISVPGDRPQLLFTEASCVQCGMCERACPEEAISLTPRFVFARETALAPQLLHEEKPFHCVRCGKAFATARMMEAIGAKLAGHWMFQDETARLRLQMCDECRVIDMFEKGDGFQPSHPSE